MYPMGLLPNGRVISFVSNVSEVKLVTRQVPTIVGSAAFAELAAQKKCTPAQLAIAWVLAQGEDIIPIPGTKKTKYLRENAAAVDIELSGSDLQDIQAVMDKYPNTGMRYADGAMKLVDRD